MESVCKIKLIFCPFYVLLSNILYSWYIICTVSKVWTHVNLCSSLFRKATNSILAHSGLPIAMLPAASFNFLECNPEWISLSQEHGIGSNSISSRPALAPTLSAWPWFPSRPSEEHEHECNERQWCMQRTPILLVNRLARNKKRLEWVFQFLKMFVVGCNAQCLWKSMSTRQRTTKRDDGKVFGWSFHIWYFTKSCSVLHPAQVHLHTVQ